MAIFDSDNVVLVLYGLVGALLGLFLGSLVTDVGDYIRLFGSTGMSVGVLVGMIMRFRR